MAGDVDLGLFGPRSVSWRVHAEPILWVAGIRSLYLQALLPRAVAGVVQNSDYRTDSWGRLMRTAEYVGTVVYGTTEQAVRAGARVRGLHARLRAVDPATGEEFRIDDPELLMWVHVTEVESFVTTARRAGLSLTDREVDQYLAEQVRAAELVGLDPHSVPSSAEAVNDYYSLMRPSLALTPPAVEVARFLAVPPMPHGLGWTPARPAWFGVAAVAFGLLPRWARRLYRMPGLPTTGVAATLAARVIRVAFRALPLKPAPIYTAAMRRAERHTTAP
ncbi:MAG TPA: oxygenase MpaB family protein [Jiangellales bacterium]|nr:oxygenase MpaB family protein [Jiangellales bacterium]